jgi:hypothetical protein
MLMVMYKGNAPALNALMGGEINLLFDVVNIAMGQVKSGRVRAIASTAPRRGIGPLGDLPVMAEAIPGFDLVTWHGVMVAPGTPPALLQHESRVQRGAAASRRAAAPGELGSPGDRRLAGGFRRPAPNRGTADRAQRDMGVPPPERGTVFRVVEFPPEPKQMSREAVLKEMGIAGPSADRHPAMHKTRSVDYAVVLEGGIDMLLDDSEVHLSAGDVLVQQGTNHAWVNRSGKPCRIAFVLIDAAAG